MKEASPKVDCATVHHLAGRRNFRRLVGNLHGVVAAADIAAVDRRHGALRDGVAGFVQTRRGGRAHRHRRVGGVDHGNACSLRGGSGIGRIHPDGGGGVRRGRCSCTGWRGGRRPVLAFGVNFGIRRRRHHNRRCGLRRRRRRRWGYTWCVDRLQLRERFRIDRCRRRRREPVAFIGAVDRRIFDLVAPAARSALRRSSTHRHRASADRN